MRIPVPERGHADIDTERWSSLQESKDFERLLSEGVLEVAYLAPGRVRLKGACYVGRAICGDVILDLHEKIEGAFTALLSHASGKAFKLSKAHSGTSEVDRLASMIVSQFLDAVTIYASAGRLFEYAKRSSVGPLAGGRLQMTKCIKLRTRGLGHLLAFEKNCISFNVPANRVIMCALVAIERIAKLVPLGADALAKSRALSLLFSDARSNLLILDRAYVVALAQKLSRDSSAESVRDMMALASVIVSEQSFGPTWTSSAQAPRTWFVNLETLFERAVRRVLSDILDVCIVCGKDAPARIFDGNYKNYSANPDLVMRSPLGVLVGDVKYKECNGLPAAADVYQLLVHAEAFDAKAAFLLYPGAEYSCRKVGKTRGGIDAYFFSISVVDLPGDLSKMVGTLQAETALF